MLSKGLYNICKEMYESKRKNTECNVIEQYQCPFRRIERETGDEHFAEVCFARTFANICVTSEFSSSWRYGVPLT